MKYGHVHYVREDGTTLTVEVCVNHRKIALRKGYQTGPGIACLDALGCVICHGMDLDVLRHDFVMEAVKGHQCD